MERLSLNMFPYMEVLCFHIERLGTWVEHLGTDYAKEALCVIIIEIVPLQFVGIQQEVTVCDFLSSFVCMCKTKRKVWKNFFTSGATHAGCSWQWDQQKTIPTPWQWHQWDPGYRTKGFHLRNHVNQNSLSHSVYSACIRLILSGIFLPYVYVTTSRSRNASFFPHGYQCTGNAYDHFHSNGTNFLLITPCRRSHCLISLRRKLSKWVIFSYHSLVDHEPTTIRSISITCHGQHML